MPATSKPRPAFTRCNERAEAQPLHRPDAFVPDESPGYLMRLALNSMQAQIERTMARHDITAMQWQPLYFLSREEHCTAGDLARRMQVDTGAVTRMLDRLEAKGLIARNRSKSDRRVVELSLTASGRASARHIPDAICATLNTHLAGFKANEAEQLKAFLRRVIANGAADSMEKPT